MATIGSSGTRLQGGTYKNYLLTVLLVVLAFNQVESLALGLAMQDIKVDLVLSDTQLGLLSGLAFALFYSIMGLPIARWADRGNRIKILSVTTALWCAAVTLCGFAGSFVQLLIIRVGVAVGEAGCMPPSHSLLADYFTREERPRTMSIYMLGGPLSIVISYLAAGWLIQYLGWRIMFILLGLPGLILALVIHFTLREPRLTSYPSPAASVVPQSDNDAMRLQDVFMRLWNLHTFRQLLLCYSVSSFFGYGIAKWLPAFFIRSYGMKTAELGMWFAGVLGVAGIVGTFGGGVLASRYAAGNEQLQLKAMAGAYCIIGVLSVLTYLSPTAGAAIGLMGLGALIGCTASGPLFATIQTLVPEHMRATSIAIIFLFGNLFGMGLGPLATGIFSDMLQPLVGQESLRYSLLTLCLGHAPVAWYAWQASKTVTDDLALA